MVEAATAASKPAAAKPSSSKPSAACAAAVARHAHDQAPPFLRQPRGPDPVHRPQRPPGALAVREHDEREALGPASLSVGDDADGAHELLVAAPSSDPGRGVELAEGLERGLGRRDVETLVVVLSLFLWIGVSKKKRAEIKTS